MRAVLTRLREPSTWGGIALLVTAAVPNVSPDLMQGVSQLGTAAAGLALMFLREAPKP